MSDRRIMREFVIGEISAVDFPAQKGARSLLMKRHDDADKPLDIEAIVAAAVAKVLENTAKPGNSGDAMTTEMDALKKQLDEATLRLADMSKVLALNSAHREFYDSLAEGDRPAFLAKSATDRDGEIAKRASADPEVYKTDDGLVIRKSMDPTGLLVRMAKSADEANRLAKAERIAREDAEFAKRAGAELNFLPGSSDAKVTLLRKVGEIADDKVRGEVLSILKAGNAALAPLFKRVGVGGDAPADGDDPSTKLEKMARDRASKENVSYEVAYEKNLDDNTEARRLYADMERARAKVS